MGVPSRQRARAIAARIALCAVVLAGTGAPSALAYPLERPSAWPPRPFFARPWSNGAGSAAYRFWYAHAQAKVYPTTGAPSSAQLSNAGLAKPLTLSGARAEYEGVQIALRPSGVGIKEVWVSSSDLVGSTNSTSQARIPASNVSVFKVGYVDVKYPSYGYSRKGLEPDPLIPMTLINGQRLGWMPNGGVPNPAHRTIGADTTQPLYVLFKIPTDAAAGYYRGTLKITAQTPAGVSIPDVSIPVILRVYPFSVEQRTLKTSVGVNMQWAMYASTASHGWLPRNPDPGPQADRIPEATTFKGDQLEGWFRYLAEHRVSPQVMLPAWESGSDWAPPADNDHMIARTEYLTDYLGTGSATTFSGSRMAFSSVKMPEYGAPSWVQDPFASSSNQARAATYYSTMRSELAPWLSKAFVYPVDEPPASKRAFIEKYAAFVHKHAPGAKFFLTTDPVTMSYRPLSGVDVYGQKLQFFYRDKPRWIDPIRRSGKGVWIYSHATTWQKDVPMYLVDKPLPESRVQGWFAYHTRADGLLHFNVSAWRPTGSSSYRDPYKDPLSYRSTVNGKPIYANGDGSLVYPGYYPAYGLVIQGSPPVGSLRMEALRDGLEDYEYVKLLEAKKGRDAADSYVAKIIGKPTGVPVAGKPSFPSYAKSHSTYESVRRSVAVAIGQ